MPELGQYLSHYSITGKIGKGGMGEVFRAKDQKLGRDVAIKILPEEFARDAHRIARFQREAKLLASLNHQNIAAIYGLEEADGTHFLVLELVEGETLAEQIKGGPVDVDEALNLGLQIAEALEAAHERGVIHRDLKPANIKVTPERKIKVLDFGLAKAFAGEQEQMSLSNSPTLSEMATQQGLILGTAAYMSPEQARGKAVDKRTDIWAFGCVLYEMLTGQAAFNGEDISEILASVIKGGVNLDLLPVSIDPRVREIITRCLQKDLKKRYRDIGDVLLELEQAVLRPPMAEPTAESKPRSKLRLVLPWVAATFVATAIVAGMAGWNLRPPPEPHAVTRFSYELPKDQQFSDLVERDIAISPDGKQFVYAANDGLYLRSLDELDAKIIAGSAGNPQNPFFSPDGKWIGYWSGADSQLKKIVISGGAPVAVSSADQRGAFSWSADNTILFGTALHGIMQVSANGGTPETIVKDERQGENPEILPGGKSVIYEQVMSMPPKVMVQSLQSGERKELLTGYAARYLPTGHIVYQNGDNLLAIRFDLDSLKVVGGPVSVVEGVSPLQYAVSESGTLIYVPGIEMAQRTLVWLDRNGKEEPLPAPPNSYSDPRISPDGTRVALGVNTFITTDIWIWDLVRKSLSRLTSGATRHQLPVWTPDGKRIIYFAFHEAGYGTHWKAADGTGKDEPLIEKRWVLPASWSGDGKTLVAEEETHPAAATGGVDIGTLALEGERKWRPILEGSIKRQPRISRDGRWMAYTSNESGKNEVYVRPFPDVEKGRWQVSTGGGDSPLWSPDGRQIFYRNNDAVMAVAVKTDPAFSLETPTILFRGNYVSANLTGAPPELNPWDLSPDGKRFLMMKEAPPSAEAAAGPRRINIVLNWFEELKRRVPVK